MYQQNDFVPSEDKQKDIIQVPAVARLSSNQDPFNNLESFSNTQLRRGGQGDAVTCKDCIAEKEQMAKKIKRAHLV